MQYTELENKLKKRVRIQRIVKAVLSVVFFAITMIFYVLYENSKVVEDIGLRELYNQYIHPEVIDTTSQTIWDHLAAGDVLDVF